MRTKSHGSRLSWVVAQRARGLVGRCLRPFWRAVQQAESPSFSAVWHPPGVHLCLPWLVSPSTFKIWCLLIVSHLSGTLLLRPASTGNFWIPKACPWEQAPALSDSVDLV